MDFHWDVFLEQNLGKIVKWKLKPLKTLYSLFQTSLFNSPNGISKLSSFFVSDAGPSFWHQFMSSKRWRENNNKMDDMTIIWNWQGQFGFKSVFHLFEKITKGQVKHLRLLAVI